MKGLAIDCAVSKLTIAAKNDDKKFISIYDIGMKQSEIIVPAIDFAIEKAGLAKNELEYLVLTVGPGSFTGLRLAISALKAIEMVYNIPLYGISSLEAYSFAYKNLDFPIVSAIDANKDRFYCRISKSETIILNDGDYEIDTLKKEIESLDEIFIVGPDSIKLKAILAQEKVKTKINTLQFEPNGVESLFEIAETKIANNEEPLKDFDGPVYLRASEAELKLNENK